MEAGYEADFESIEILNEPTAVAIAYGLFQISAQGKYYLFMTSEHLPRIYLFFPYKMNRLRLFRRTPITILVATHLMKN